jgi:hypothetical protein
VRLVDVAQIRLVRSTTRTTSVPNRDRAGRDRLRSTEATALTASRQDVSRVRIRVDAEGDPILDCPGCTPIVRPCDV